MPERDRLGLRSSSGVDVVEQVRVGVPDVHTDAASSPEPPSAEPFGRTVEQLLGCMDRVQPSQVVVEVVAVDVTGPRPPTRLRQRPEERACSGSAQIR